MERHLETDGDFVLVQGRESMSPMRSHPVLVFTAVALLLSALRPGSLRAGSARRMTDAKAWSVEKWEKEVDLLSVTFPGGEKGWIVGDKGTILHTEDGGATWTAQDAPTELELRAVDFADENHGIAVGGGNGMKRKGADKVVHDKNETIPLKGGKIDIREALKKARAKRKNWALALRTEDGGKTWEKIRIDSNFPQWGISMVDRDRAWATSGHAKEHPDGHFRHTLDGGGTWRTAPPGPYERPARPLYGIRFVDENHGWAVGSHSLIGLVGGAAEKIVLYREKKGSVIHTADGGKTWEVQDPGNPKDVYLLGLCFLDPKKGWVVGERGAAYATTDGGRKWKKQKTEVKASLYAADFFDGKRGLLVGARGTLLVTTDGGRRWRAVKLDLKADLLDVAFLSRNAAVVVGEGGVILRYGE
jgi:photosystem II stability/assembly factor-like uncharacterized protein